MIALLSLPYIQSKPLDQVASCRTLDPLEEFDVGNKACNRSYDLVISYDERGTGAGAIYGHAPILIYSHWRSL